MTTLSANQIAFNTHKVATEIKAPRVEITALDVQIAAWRAAFDAEVAAATTQESAAQAM